MAPWIAVADLNLEDKQVQSVLQTLNAANLDALADRALSCRLSQNPGLTHDLFCVADADKIAYGKQNIVVKLKFSDGAHWVARIRIKREHHEKMHDDLDLLITEIATMNLVRRRTTIPIPAVHDSSCATGSPCEIGVLYLLMDYIEGSRMPRYGACTSESARSRLVRHFASCLYQLSTIRFGRLGFVKENTEMGPLSFFSAVPLPGRGRPVNTSQDQRPVKAPRTSLEYFYRLRKRLNDDPLSSYYAANINLPAARQFLLQAVPSAILPQYMNGPFMLSHSGMHPDNVLVDSSCNIVAVLGWRDQQIVPLELFAANSEFITNSPLSDEQNKPCVRFAKQVSDQIRLLAGQNRDPLGVALAKFINSPQRELVDRLIFTRPFWIQRDILRVMRLLYGDKAKWEDMEKMILDGPIFAAIRKQEAEYEVVQRNKGAQHIEYAEQQDGAQHSEGAKQDISVKRIGDVEQCTGVQHDKAVDQHTSVPHSGDDAEQESEVRSTEEIHIHGSDDTQPRIYDNASESQDSDEWIALGMGDSAYDLSRRIEDR